jgi:hypothetical protein
MALDLVIKPIIGKEVIGSETPHGVELINIPFYPTTQEYFRISARFQYNTKKI